MSKGRWFRDVYRDAVWEAETLSAAEKAVAETYARHARDQRGEKSATADEAWVDYPRIMAKAGIRRRENVAAAVTGLVKAGWFVPIREIPRRSTVYRLTIPELGSSTTGTTRTADRSSDGGTTVVPPEPAGSSAPPEMPHPRSSDGGTQPSSGPSKRPPSSAVRSVSLVYIGDGLGVDDDEATWIIETAISRARGPIRKSELAYLKAIPPEDYATMREEYRAAQLAQAAPSDAEIAKARRAAPDCGHGTRNGTFIHPVHGTARCPRCRRGLPVAEPEPVDGPPDPPTPRRAPTVRRQTISPCGQYNCHNGVLKIGINERPCPNCNQPEPGGSTR